MTTQRAGYNTLVLIGILVHVAAFIYIVLLIIYPLNGSHFPVLAVSSVLLVIWSASALALRVNFDIERKTRSPGVFLGVVLLSSSLVLALSELPFSEFSFISYTFSALFVAIFYDKAFSLAANGIAGLLTGLILIIVNRAIVGGVVFFVSLLITGGSAVIWSMIDDWKKMSRMFDQAKWAASELTNVVMRLEDSIHKARIEAQNKERSRIARQVHDTVGYSLTAVIVQLNVVRELVQRKSLRSRIEQLEELMRQSLKDTRETVTVLRKENSEGRNESWRDTWIRLCNIFSNCTGVRIHVIIGDELRAVDGEVGEALYRMLQESLTNAYRHGRATFIDVAMKWKKELKRILFRVSDNGIGCKHVEPGNGINGIMERVTALQGEVVWNTLPNKGFDIGIDIPWEITHGKDTNVGG